MTPAPAKNRTLLDINSGGRKRNPNIIAPQPTKNGKIKRNPIFNTVALKALCNVKVRTPATLTENQGATSLPKVVEFKRTICGSAGLLERSHPPADAVSIASGLQFQIPYGGIWGDVPGGNQEIALDRFWQTDATALLVSLLRTTWLPFTTGTQRSCCLQSRSTPHIMIMSPEPS